MVQEINNVEINNIVRQIIQDCENEFYERANLNTTFEFKIKNEGIKLYEKY